MRIRVLIIFLLCCQFCFSQNWQPLGSGLDYWTTSMYSDSVTDRLIVAGAFSTADSQTMHGITNYNDSFNPMWTSSPTCPVGSLGGSVWAMQRYASWIYFGGNFDCMGGLDNPSLARWNGTNWDTIPGGGIPYQDGVVRGMTVYNNELYICGTFNSISGVNAHQIAKFDGANWSTVGDNYFFNDILSEIIFYHGNMYVAGNIIDPQGNLYRLAMWNGSSWTYFNVPDMSGGIHDLEVYNDELYVSGEFYYGNGTPGMAIIRWDDNTWRDVGGSVQYGPLNSAPTIENMLVHDGKLYCVGNFEKIGGINAAGLASWDGTQWCGYDANFGGSQPFQFAGANYIEFFRDTMYVSGGFMFIDSMQVNFIAKWIGGTFVDTCGTAVGINEPEPIGSNLSVKVFPNPAQTVTTFQFEDNAERTILITDNLGREVWRRQANELTIEFPAFQFAEGMYFYSIFRGSVLSAQGKLIVNH